MKLYDLVYNLVFLNEEDFDNLILFLDKITFLEKNITAPKIINNYNSYGKYTLSFENHLLSYDLNKFNLEYKISFYKKNKDIITVIFDKHLNDIFFFTQKYYLKCLIFSDIWNSLVKESGLEKEELLVIENMSELADCK